MTKTVHPVLKKTGAVLLTVLVLVLMAVPAFAVALPDAPTGYVYDGANVLSSSTESYIERTGSALAEACGAEVVVATVDFTDGEDIADYAYDLFNKWGIGDKKANNGLLILLSIGAEDYYAEPGVGLTDVFTGGVLDAMLYDYLEDDFAAKEYDSGVKKVYARAVEILEDHYNVSYSTGTTNNANANTNYNYANNNTSGGFLSGVQNVFSQARRVVGTRIIRFVFIVLFVILIIALSVLRPRRRYYRRGWGAPRLASLGRSPSRWRTLRRFWQRPFGRRCAARRRRLHAWRRCRQKKMSIWVLFDLDGTLVDNSEGITKSTQFALDSYGYPNQPMETLKKFIGPPLHESFMEFYGFSKEQAFEAVDRYRVRYKEKGVYENRLYPGMKELLEALKSAGVKLSVSTSKPTVFTEKILKQNGIFELFDQIVGANLDGSMTDKTEVMQEAMRRAGGKENNTFFMVGDRSFDMIGAKNCGVPGIGVYFGFAEPGELEEAGADYTVETTEHC